MRPSVEVLRQLFEDAPGFVSRVAEVEADDWDTLFERAREIALTMPRSEQLELLAAHPRIGAQPNTVSALSYREQGYDRDTGTTQLQARLDRLNAEYERRFGFRFVVFVNGRSRAEIADVMETRIAAPHDDELRRGLSDVIAIAQDRFRKLATQTEEKTP